MRLRDCQVRTIRLLRNGQVPDRPPRSVRPLPSAPLWCASSCPLITCIFPPNVSLFKTRPSQAVPQCNRYIEWPKLVRSRQFSQRRMRVRNGDPNFGPTLLWLAQFSEKLRCQDRRLIEVYRRSIRTRQDKALSAGKPKERPIQCAGMTFGWNAHFGLTNRRFIADSWSSGGLVMRFKFLVVCLVWLASAQRPKRTTFSSNEEKLEKCPKSPDRRQFLDFRWLNLTMQW